MNSPRISVCMATYNGSRYIRCQLETILSQLMPNDELIISDDASNDDTREIIREVCGERARLVQGSFRNPALNFENAIKQATGDIIVLSDQDDLWLPNKLSIIRERFTATHPKVYLLVLDAEVIDEAGKTLHDSVFQRFRRFGPGLSANIYDNSYIGCCMAFSRELLAFALPFPRRISMHDVWLGLIAELFGKTEFIPIKTMRYRKHGASATDFGIRFSPWAQIKRRWWLACYLTTRYFQCRKTKSL